MQRRKHWAARVLRFGALLMLLSALSGQRADVHAATSSLTLNSSSSFLNSGFTWAKQRALDWVQTGKNPNYIPSYWAGLTPRAAFYSRDVAHQMLGAHLLGLDTENKSMLKTFAASATPARRWYPLWAFGFDGSIFRTDYTDDNNFVRELPAAFELVEKGSRQYLWTADTSYINDSALWTFYTTSVNDYISAHDDNHNTVADEDGTGKIRQGVASYNEGGEGLKEAGDAIGSQYQALLAYANIQRARGDTAGAASTETRAANLKSHFNTNWFSSSANRYIRGFTAAGPKTDFGKENSWFMPMKLITAPGSRTDAYLNFIDSTVTSLPKFNIEAYTYLPETFFPYSRNEQGWKWLKYLINSRADYPEVSYTVIGHIVEGLLGVEPNAPQHSLATRSHLPGEIGWLEVDHIKLGGHDLKVRHEGATRSTLTHNSGPAALTWEAQFDGSHGTLSINGTPRSATIKTVNGKTVSSVTVSLLAGQSAVVEIASTGGDGSPFNGTPAAVPGTVQAEDYNTGGQGVAFNDTDTTNNGGQYRASEAVDIQATTDTGGGFNVGWTRTSEWLKYTINVGTAGSYTFQARVASAAAGASFHAEIDGANVTGALSVPNTGGNQTWTTISKSGISLTAGQHVLRVVFDSAVTGGVASGNYNFFSFSSGGPTPTPTVSYEAEAGGNTLSGTARLSSCTACSGGQKVGFIGNGAANFITINNVNASSSGSRMLTIHYLVNGTRSFFVSVNGAAAVEVPCTGTSFATPASTSITVQLNAGSNTIRLFNNSAFAPDLDRIVVQ